jgi:hypothetical protein
MRDLRGTIVRVSVSEGDVRHQVRERHGGGFFSLEKDRGGFQDDDCGKTERVGGGFMVSGFCGGGDEERTREGRNDRPRVRRVRRMPTVVIG